MPRLRQPKVTDLGPRAERAKAIAESLFGRVISRDRHTMVIEVPADLFGAAGRSLGMGGFTWNIGPQSTRMATKRMTGGQDQFIICHGHQELMAYFEINVDLTPRDVKVFDPAEPLTPAPAVAAITRQVKP
jgi:hypothetical protein